MHKKVFVKQNGYMDCAAASLAMIIRYYGGYVSVDKLSMMLGTSKDGTNALELVSVARDIGMECSGMKADLDSITSLKEPFIAHTTINGYNHYVVIYEVNIKRKYIIMADPTSGVKKLTILEFLKIWNETVFVLSPNKELPHDRNIKVISFISSLLKSYYKILSLIMFLSSLLFIVSIVVSFYYRKIIDDHVINGVTSIFLTFFLFLLGPCISYIRNKLVVYFQKSFDMHLFTDVFTKIINLPYSFYHNRTTGEVMVRINDLSHIKSTIVDGLIVISTDTPLFITTFILILIINYKIGLVYLIMCIGYYLFHYKYFDKYSKNLITFQKERETFNSYLIQNIESIEMIKGLERQDEVITDVVDKHRNLVNYESKIHSFLYKINFKKDLFIESSFVVILLFISYLVSNEILEFSMILVFYMLIQNGLNSLKNILGFTYSYKEAKYTIMRNMELSYYEDLVEKIDDVNNYDVEYQNVSLSYNRLDKIIDNVSFKICSSEKVLVLGESGCGKSTLFQLLKHYYPRYEGTIKIGNRNIKDCSRNIMKNILYISQQERLCTGTLYENITLGQAVSDVEVKEVCSICSITNDLKMRVEENGFNLSGGERDRIVLARTLLRPFKILVIDEGFGQMDSNLERVILKKIFSKYSDKTIIVISHRIDHMDLFDKRIILSSGVITDEIFKN